MTRVTHLSLSLKENQAQEQLHRRDTTTQTLPEEFSPWLPICRAAAGMGRGEGEVSPRLQSADCSLFLPGELHMGQLGTSRSTSGTVSFRPRRAAPQHPACQPRCHRAKLPPWALHQAPKGATSFGEWHMEAKSSAQLLMSQREISLAHKAVTARRKKPKGAKNTGEISEKQDVTSLAFPQIISSGVIFRSFSLIHSPLSSQASSTRPSQPAGKAPSRPPHLPSVPQENQQSQ